MQSVSINTEPISYLLTTYVLLNKEGKQLLLLSYNDGGYLVGFQWLIEPTEQQMVWLTSNIPWADKHIETIVERSNGKVKVEIVPHNIGFEAFWNAFGYKVGDKAKCIKLWDKLKDNERLACIRSFKKYELFLEQKGTAKVWPERYLSRKYWENEF